MITLTRISEPAAKSYLFTIDRNGELSLRLTRFEAIARLDCSRSSAPKSWSIRPLRVAS